MEIRVKCVCGTAYAFEDTPVEGRLAFPVSCTNCGVDGTEKAHAYIAAKLAEPADSPETTKPRKGFLGFKKRKDEFAELDAPINPNGEEDSVSETGDETSVKRLLLAGGGALAVGAAGAIGWLHLAKSTGYEFGIVAWALGGLVGGTSKLLAPRGHYWLGVTGALAAALAIGGGELLTAHWAVHGVVRRSVSSAYEQAAGYAKQAVEAESDEELRPVVAQYKLATAVVDESPKGAITTYQRYQVADSHLTLFGVIEDEGRRKITFAQREEVSNEGNVTEAQMERFKTRVLPQLKVFAQGKPSQEEYRSALTQMIMSRVTFRSLVIQSMSPYSGLWVILGIATAYKLARNPGLQY